MPRPRLLLAAALAAATPGASRAAPAQPPAPTTAPAPAAATAGTAIRALLAAYDRAWSRRDAQAVAALLTEPADVVNRFGRWTGAVGRAEHARTLAGLMATVYRGHEPPRHAVQQVRLLRPDVALVHAFADHDAVRLPSGRTIPPFREVTTYVVVQEGGRWRITSANLQNVSAPPGPGGGPR